MNTRATTKSLFSSPKKGLELNEGNRMVVITSGGNHVQYYPLMTLNRPESRKQAP